MAPNSNLRIGSFSGLLNIIPFVLLQERVARGQKTNYGLVEFRQTISMRRAFGAKVQVRSLIRKLPKFEI